MSRRSFRYALIEDPASRQQARDHAATIRRLADHSGLTVLEIGQRLITIHRLLQPALFRQWARAEFCWTLSTVSNYMQAAERFAGVEHPERFQPSAMFALVRKQVPESIIADAVRVADSGSPVTLTAVKRLLTQAGVEPLSAAAGRRRKPATIAAAAGMASYQQDPAAVLSRWCDEIQQRWTLLVEILSATDREWLADCCEQVAERLRCSAAC